MRAERDVWALASCLALAALYLALFRPGYSVMGGGDFALYLSHAQAIAEGRSYAATGFVYNPANAIMSPAAYPPGLPLLLAPVVALLGLDFTAIKLAMLAAVLGMLWALHRLALPDFGPRWSAVLVLAAGLSPAILMRRDAIGADMPASLQGRARRQHIARDVFPHIGRAIEALHGEQPRIGAGNSGRRLRRSASAMARS